jgi:hypothetical protein
MAARGKSLLDLPKDYLDRGNVHLSALALDFFGSYRNFLYVHPLQEAVPGDLGNIDC